MSSSITRNSQPTLIVDSSNNVCEIKNNSLNVSLATDFPCVLLNSSYIDYSISGNSAFPIIAETDSMTPLPPLGLVITQEIQLSAVKGFIPDSLTFNDYKFLKTSNRYRTTHNMIIFTVTPSLTGSVDDKMELRISSGEQHILKFIMFGDNTFKVELENVFAPLIETIDVDSILSDATAGTIRIFFELSMDYLKVGEIYKGELNTFHTFCVTEPKDATSIRHFNRIQPQISLTHQSNIEWILFWNNLQILEKPTVKGRRIPIIANLEGNSGRDMISDYTVPMGEEDFVYSSPAENTIIHRMSITMVLSASTNGWLGGAYAAGAKIGANDGLKFWIKRNEAEFFYFVNPVEILCNADWHALSQSVGTTHGPISLAASNFETDSQIIVVDFGPDGIILNQNDQFGVTAKANFSTYGFLSHYVTLYTSVPNY